MTLRQLVNKYSKQAQANNKDVEKVKFLIMELSGFSNHDFYLNYDLAVDSDTLKKMDESISLYINSDTPVQHILGFSYFFGHKFLVNEDTLIPRRETEELVENVLIYYDKYFSNEVVSVADLGCGSGCIGLTLSIEEKNMKVSLYDISDKALSVAKKNAIKLNCNVNFDKSDWFSNINNKFDIIVANPPYIPDDEVLENEVLQEPHISLFGGMDGTNHYDTILKNAVNHINDKAIIAFEHGYQQKDRIKEIVHLYFENAKIIQKKDMQSKDRFTFVFIGDFDNE